MLLERIASPADVKKLDKADLPQLCAELREFLVQSIAHTGGHLASNLGVVELTVAIHRIYDTSKDRLVLDVGHQCYVHKILTGRRDRFPTLRQFGGLAGFPRPEESAHDAFIAGHASNSVSVALGMARARTLQKADYAVCALIGDGALTGGLAYEGLSDAGASGEPLVVILNDNGMSINRNVGGMAKHLSRLRIRPGYYHFKKGYHAFMSHLPGGRALYRFNHRIKSGVKRAIYSCSMFEDMGLNYLGPVDGHNLDQLCTTLAWARELNRPVLVHVRTVKGKGYPPAETQPERCHGVAPFDPRVGIVAKPAAEFSTVFGQTLVELAGEEKRICAITAAMGDGTGLQPFARAWPKRFFDVGIAEGHAVSMAAGMARQGMIPVFAVYSTFLQRGFDMLLHDVALQGLHVIFAVDRAGLVGADGPTHHGSQDVAYLSQIPGMTVFCPACFADLRGMLRAAVAMDGPVALRYPRGGEDRKYPLWRGESVRRLREGADITLVSYGVLCGQLLDAATLLAARGVQADVISLCQISPLDIEPIAASVRKTRRLLVLEDSSETGAIGQQICADLMQISVFPQTCILKNLGRSFAPQGTVDELRHTYGLDAPSIADTVLTVLQNPASSREAAV